MNLSHIKTEVCPHCGSKPSLESISGRHSNGENFENRVFECGHRVEYKPNMQREETIVECAKSQAIIARAVRYQSLHDDIQKLIAPLTEAYPADSTLARMKKETTWILLSKLTA